MIRCVDQTLRGSGDRAAATKGGFTLVELLLAFGLGMTLCAIAMQAVLAEGQSSLRLSRVLRERPIAQRALDLMRGDLQRSTNAIPMPATAPVNAACNMAGRTVVLHLETPEGPVTYSVGKPGEPIWRGQVLMRCGPAFTLDGTPSPGQALNRVVLDGLGLGGVVVKPQNSATLLVQFSQQLVLEGKSSQALTHQRLMPWPSTF